ncbi:MAG: hypothetical protein NUV81_01590 [bacterium]|nr:hypothetical protein [bacterium]
MNSSYIYIYDDFLTDRQFERDVAALETELNTYDMAGQIGRLALFRSARDLVMSMVHDHVTTIVIVGNDSTLDKTMWFLPDLNIPIGYIPVANPSAIADLLGIPMGARACEALSARNIETMDMGKLDDRYFLTEVSLPSTFAGIEVDGKYTISSRYGGALSVRNLGGLQSGRMDFADAQDGFLEVVITPESEEQKSFLQRRGSRTDTTKIMLEKGKIVSREPMEAFVDNHIVRGHAFHVSVAPSALRFITGRGRLRVPEASLQRVKRDGTLRSSRVSLPRGSQKPVSI